MINFLERNPKIALAVSLFIAAAIFYFSSFTQEQAQNLGPSFPLKSVIYHFTIFFLLAFFLSVYLMKKKNLKGAILTSSICILYSIGDEFHQLFVSGRLFSLFDIFTDVSGIILAVLVVLVFKNHKKFS